VFTSSRLAAEPTPLGGTVSHEACGTTAAGRLRDIAEQRLGDVMNAIREQSGKGED
jgi:hypothetical protein